MHTVRTHTQALGTQEFFRFCAQSTANTPTLYPQVGYEREGSLFKSLDSFCEGQGPFAAQAARLSQSHRLLTLLGSRAGWYARGPPEDPRRCILSYGIRDILILVCLCQLKPASSRTTSSHKSVRRRISSEAYSPLWPASAQDGRLIGNLDNLASDFFWTIPTPGQTLRTIET